MGIYIQEYIEHLGLYKVMIDDYHYQVQAYMSKSELEAYARYTRRGGLE